MRLDMRSLVVLAFFSLVYSPVAGRFGQADQAGIDAVYETASLEQPILIRR